MGFFSSIISATVKTALTPIAVVKDTVSVVAGEEPTATANLVDSALDDLEDAVDL